MKKKKLLGLLLLTMLIALTGCSSSGSNKESKKKSDKKEGLKIAIVTSPSGVDDGSFNQNNYDGIKEFIKKNPDSTVKAINEKTGAAAASIKAVEDIVADYDVIVTPGFQFADISKVAVDNPDKYFILVDSNPNPVEDKKEFKNVLAMTFAEQQNGFFAGVAAALETKTDKVAFVGGSAFPPVVNYQFGFASGVNYANKVYGTKAELVEIPSFSGTDLNKKNIKGNYVGNFNDVAKGKDIGNALIEKGADIIFPAAGNSGNGVFTAAKESNGKAMVIGCDVDQFDDGKNGDKNVVLTSVLKVMDLNVNRALEEISKGKFKGKNEIKGADTDSTGFVSKEGRQQLSKETLDKLKEVFDKVKKGEIEPAGQFTKTTPENFKGLPK